MVIPDTCKREFQQDTYSYNGKFLLSNRGKKPVYFHVEMPIFLDSVYIWSLLQNFIQPRILKG